jgi:[ribosomal protein S5]-alanine N-acetyltransferase
MNLVTVRLFLRDYKLSDAPEIVAIWNDREVVKWIEGIPYPCTLQKVKKILKGIKEKREEKAYYFPIILKEENKLIGNIWIRHLEEETDYKIGEVGILLSKKYWGKGYATEALTGLISWGFHTLKLRKIYGKANIENKASQKTMKKIGFKLEGKLRKEVRIRFINKICDVMYYGLLKEEWKK